MILLGLIVYLIGSIADIVSSWDFDDYPRIFEKNKLMRDKDGKFDPMRNIAVTFFLSLPLFILMSRNWFEDQDIAGLIYGFAVGMCRGYLAYRNRKLKAYEREQGHYQPQ